MEAAQLVLMLWGAHTILAGALTAPIAYLGRRRVDWHKWELLAFFLPFGLWTGLMTLNYIPKSLSNLGEYFCIAIAIPIAAIIRLVIGRRFSQDATASTLQIVLCLFALCTYIMTPPLAE